VIGVVLRSSHIALIVFVAVAGARVRADTSRIAAAQRAYDELRFEDVLAEVSAARGAGPLGHKDAVELTRLEAYTYAIFNDSPRAVDAFRRLLALEPGFEPRGVSPKIRTYFEEARRTQPVTVTASDRPAPERRSFVGSPWFWAGTATAVAVTSVAVWLVVRSEGPDTGNLETLTLP
jgi:hypothetical protein